jgi:hypothetical protein
MDAQRGMTRAEPWIIGILVAALATGLWECYGVLLMDGASHAT